MTRVGFTGLRTDLATHVDRVEFVVTRQNHEDMAILQPAEFETLRETLQRSDPQISPTPSTGLGEPGPLKGNLEGWWSCGITGGHRLVHRVGGTGTEQVPEILSRRWHYAS